MTTKKILVLLAAIVALAGTATAKPKQSYNLQRAIEAASIYDTEEAMQYLQRELTDNPKNGEAYAWAAWCQVTDMEYAKALTSIDKAFQYLPKKEKGLREWMYRLTCSSCLALGDTAIAIEAISQAIRLDPDASNFNRRAELLLELGLNDAALSDFYNILIVDPNYADAYVGIAYILKEKGRYEEAIKELDKAEKRDNEHAGVYALRGICNLRLGKNAAATDDFIRSMELAPYKDAVIDEFAGLDEETAEILLIKIEAKQAADPTNVDWFVLEAVLQEKQKLYSESIKTVKKAKAISNGTDYFDYMISRLYDKQHDNEHALKYINLAIEGDSTDQTYRLIRADIYIHEGRFAEAHADLQYALEDDPENSILHHYIGVYQYLLGQTDAAIKSFTSAIAFDSSGQSYYWKGFALQQKGDSVKGRKALEQCIATDTILFYDVALCYARLGMREQALLFDQKRLEKDSSEDRLYNTACMYSILGDTALALDNLDSVLSSNLQEAKWAKLDPDLENIRETARFKSLIQAALDKIEAIVEKNREAEGELNEDGSLKEQETRIVEVPFTAYGGVTKVNCSINDLPLSFIFDTGCSDVTISQTEANFMLKNGFLTKKDITGRESYQTADGCISIGTTICLKRIVFGGLELTNVRASVVDSQNAPLLLGQSVLQRLGKVEIDNENKVLRITARE